jgi:hypothetical protein
MERIRRAALELCDPNHRGGVRFVGPKQRQNSWRITIENLESVDLGAFCARVAPAVVFLRQTTGADLATASRIDVYVPSAGATHLLIALRLFYAAALGAAALAASLVIMRS